MKTLATHAVPAREGNYPAEIVLRLKEERIGDDLVVEFITHLHVLPPDRESYYVWGHYFGGPYNPDPDEIAKREKLARDDFRKRCEVGR